MAVCWQQNFYLIATLGLVTPPAQVIYTSGGPVPILDDAVTTDSIYVTADQTISSVDVALRVDHPRVSDLVFHLISPDGTRVLLVENRGGTTANGMGATIAITNIVPVSSSGGAVAVHQRHQRGHRPPARCADHLQFLHRAGRDGGV